MAGTSHGREKNPEPLSNGSATIRHENVRSNSMEPTMFKVIAGIVVVLALRYRRTR